MGQPPNPVGSGAAKSQFSAAMQKVFAATAKYPHVRRMASKLSIIVVEPDRERALMIVDSLREAGDNEIHVISEASGLARRISERAPDVVIVDLTNPTRDMIEELTLATSPLDRPVAMFVDQSDDSLTKAAIEAGVSAYVVDDLRPERLRPVMAAAITRFNMFRRMRDELAETKRALEERKVIDRAKGLLMKARGIDEDEAYCTAAEVRDGSRQTNFRGCRGTCDSNGLAVMTLTTLSVAFMPLVDAAPLIAAEEMGFSREEGLALDLVRAPSWSSLRDMLAFGRVEAAQMLSPVPVAMALGIGGVTSQISALMVMSVNGNVVGVSTALAERLVTGGHDFALDDAAKAGQALIHASDGPLRIGVPFPFSMHAELLYYWLAAAGLPAPQGLSIRTIPPPLMAEALANDEIDAFCVGEPWGSKCVEAGVGSILLPGRAIWSFAPEKVLAVRTNWATDEPELTARLMRAVWKAGRWLGAGGANTTAAELLSRGPYLDLDPHIIDRALTGKLILNRRGEARDCPGFVEFFAGATHFPWKSQAAWIAAQMAGRLGLEQGPAIESAKAVFRTDLYRRYLGEAGAILPGASQKVEGGIAEGTAVSATNGRLILLENRFFDGRVFDPMDVN